jgi:hypothetical protein
MLTKIISGGQTGADMGGLLAAAEMGIPTGGWSPPDGSNESGTIDSAYGLVSTPEEYSAFGKAIPRSLRTEWNVRDSDGTILMGDREQWGQGTEFTWNMCELYDKPCLIANEYNPLSAALWITSKGIYILNIAGPSEVASPGLQELTYEFMKEVLKNTRS